jgi:hypothetical protein
MAPSMGCDALLEELLQVHKGSVEELRSRQVAW